MFREDLQKSVRYDAIKSDDVELFRLDDKKNEIKAPQPKVDLNDLENKLDHARCKLEKAMQEAISETSGRGWRLRFHSPSKSSSIIETAIQDANQEFIKFSTAVSELNPVLSQLDRRRLASINAQISSVNDTAKRFKEMDLSKYKIDSVKQMSINLIVNGINEVQIKFMIKIEPFKYTCRN